MVLCLARPCDFVIIASPLSIGLTLRRSRTTLPFPTFVLMGMPFLQSSHSSSDQEPSTTVIRLWIGTLQTAAGLTPLLQSTLKPKTLPSRACTHSITLRADPP